MSNRITIIGNSNPLSKAQSMAINAKYSKWSVWYSEQEMQIMAENKKA